MYNNEDEKSCKTCMYFLQHYIVSRDKLKAINCGHCKRINKINNGFFDASHSCNFWKLNSAKNEEFNDEMMITIKKMQKSLSQISMILKSIH